MPTVFHFGIVVLTVYLFSRVSTLCTRPITCPCGPTRREIYYTHCLNDTLKEEITCKIWSNCKTCEANVTHCLSCFPEHSGPLCAKVVSGTKTCPDPGIPDGGSRQNEDGNDDTHNYPRVFKEGESVYFSCNEEDYVLDGYPVITCTSAGTWSDSLPRCQKSERYSLEKPALGKFCKFPGVDENGMIENFEPSDSLEEDQMFPSTTRLKYKCKEGYKLEGQKAIFCLCSGEWTSDPPTCVPEVPDDESHHSVHCEGRGSISNGRVIEYRYLDRQLPSYKEYGALYPVGTYLHYSCNKGYILRGAGIVVCKSSGLWSAKEPKCIEEHDLRETTAPSDDNLDKNFVPNNGGRKNLKNNYVPDDGNPIRDFVSKAQTFRSRQESQRTGGSNSLIFKFFFF